MAAVWALNCLPVLWAQTEAIHALLSDKDVRPGLAIHLDCGDGSLTIAMAAHPKVRVIQGLTLKGDDIEKCRAKLLDQNLFGRVSIDRLATPTLPYADNLANVLVVQNVANLETSGLKLSECLRVVAPYGVAFVEKAEPEAIKKQLARARIEATVSIRDGWVKIVKSYPKAMDEWTRYGHDETMSGHSLDTMVGPASSVRWINWVNGEYWGDQGPFPGSDLVSANGRTFHMHDLEKKPRDIHIVARDAFNGIELWNIPGKAPPVKGLGMFTVHGRVYTMNSAEYPNILVALDESTGKVVQKYDNINSTMFKRYEGKQVHYGDRHHWGYESGVFLIQPDFTHLSVFDEKTGQPLWETTIPDHNAWPGGRYLFQLPAEAKGSSGLDIAKKGEYFASYFATPQGVYCIESDGNLTCRELHRGTVLWKTAAQAKSEAIFYMDSGKLFTISEGGQNPKGRLRAYTATDGRFLWSCDYLFGRDRNMAVYDGALWMAMLDGKHKSTATGVDLETGKLVKSVDLSAEFEGCTWHCFPTVTTPRWMITGGCHFFDPREKKTVSVAGVRYVRAACNIGVIPANGLMYQNLNACTCEPNIRGVVAYSFETCPVTDGKEPWRLIRGDAAAAPVQGNSASVSDWPMYRHDAARSDTTSARLPETLSQKWATALPERTWQPVVVGERVYATLTEAHAVYALSAADGHIAWRFIASGRIDTSPTYENGRLIFGDHDGCVYCLNAATGAQLWRFQAAPGSKRIMVRDQLESVWPVFGSLVVRRGTVYAVAGRNNHLDGGLTLYGLDLDCGAVRSCSKLGSLKNLSVNNDVLLDDGKHIRFDSVIVDPSNGTLINYVARHGKTRYPFLFSGCCGFAFESKISDGGRYDTERRHQHFENLHADLLCTEGTSAWGFFSGPADRNKKNLKGMGFEGEISAQAAGEPKGKNQQKLDGLETWLFYKGAGQWQLQPSAQHFGRKSMIKAMVKAGDTLYVAIQPNDDNLKEGLLLRYSADRGTLLGSLPFAAAPRFDSMAVAGQQVYLGTEDARLICLGGK